ncbi:diacylglycerol kinase domain protein [Peptoniphilus sp. oral taxon 375 str. F0436]|nr:diacylglycerol kinase domain protein [Peptoniphilus sp. oral taxon 375 str. F0436]
MEAIQAQADQVDLVVSVGGDGSNFWTLNALMKTRQRNLGLIPLGTGNDFAHALGLKKSISSQLESYKKAEKKDIYIGKIQDYYFLNIVSYGFDVCVIENYNQMAKGAHKKLAYIRAIFKTIRQDFSKFSKDNRDWPFISVLANGSYFGGGLPVAYQASPFKPDLDYIQGHVYKTKDILRLLVKVFLKNHLTDPAVQLEEKNRQEITTETEKIFNIDGELLPLKGKIIVEKPQEKIQLYGAYGM